MANDYNKENPYFATDFPAYTENFKWQNEQNFANQQAWDARLYATYEREQSQEWNEHMWNANNEYNSIGAQIERARAAGVNPAAILAGDYKSAQSNAPTTSPQGPVQANTPSSNATQRVMDGSATLVDSAKGFADNLLNAQQIALNRKQIDSQVHLNLSSMQEIAARAGVQNATEEQIRKAISWADSLNYSTVMERVSQVERVQNDFLVQLKELMIKEGVAESDIAVNESEIKVNEQNVETAKALEEKYKSEKTGIDIENKYLGRIRGNEVLMQRYELFDLHRRNEIAKLLDLPLGTSEYEFNLALAKKGYLKTYISRCLIPTIEATWTPADRKTWYSTKHGIKAFGLDFGGYSEYERSHSSSSHENLPQKPYVAGDYVYIPDLNMSFHKNAVPPVFKRKYNIP